MHLLHDVRTQRRLNRTRQPPLHERPYLSVGPDTRHQFARHRRMEHCETLKVIPRGHASLPQRMHQKPTASHRACTQKPMVTHALSKAFTKQRQHSPASNPTAMATRHQVATLHSSSVCGGRTATRADA
jgi:hypothetical protein